jgi:hypothetical protein
MQTRGDFEQFVGLMKKIVPKEPKITSASPGPAEA